MLFFQGVKPFTTNKKNRIAAVTAVFVLMAVMGCRESVSSQSEFALGTVCTITLYGGERPDVSGRVFERIRQIENLMSVTREGSDIDRINRTAGVQPASVSPETLELIEKALEFARASEGAFDPTVAPLTALWGIGGDHPRVPSEEEIEKVLPLINFHDVEIDRTGKRVFLTKPGMALDLGAIAKGFAADEAAAIIREAGIPRAIIDLGGNILTLGEKKDKSPWRVGVQNPRDSRGAYAGIVEAREKAVVTSGVYERFFDSGGARYHHIFSPRTGFPARTGLLSVTVVGDNSAGADALSTAVFVLGYEKGRALLESHPGTGGVFLFEDSSVRLAGDISFTLTDPGFRMADN